MLKTTKICAALLALSISFSALADERIYTCPYVPGEEIKANKNGWNAGEASVGDELRSYHYAFVENDVDLNNDEEQSLVCGYMYYDDDRDHVYKFSKRTDDMTLPIPLKSNGLPATCHVIDTDDTLDEDHDVTFLTGVREVQFMCEID